MWREKNEEHRGNVDMRERMKFNGAFFKALQGLHFSAQVEGLVWGELERMKVGIQLKAGKFAEVLV